MPSGSGFAHNFGVMNTCASLALLAVLLHPAAAVAQTPPAPHAAEHHEFVIDNFKTESGVVLPKARVVYGTYGHLNAARDNVILLPSHYMANHHGVRVADRSGPCARSGDPLSRRD